MLHLTLACCFPLAWRPRVAAPLAATRHQCRRHPGAAFWHRQRPVSRHSGGNGRRQRSDELAHCAKTTPATPPRTCSLVGRHARRDHRRHPAAIPSPALAAGCAGHLPRHPVRRWPAGVARQHLDASLTGFEIIHRDAYQIALRHTPTQARAAEDLMSAVGNPAPDWLVLLDAGSPQSAESLQTNLEDLDQPGHPPGSG